MRESDVWVRQYGLIMDADAAHDCTGAIDSKRSAKETVAKAKKIMREMLQHWRKRDKEERDERRRIQKEAKGEKKKVAVP